MGSKSQRKGAAGERELAQILQEYGYSYDRGGSLTRRRLVERVDRHIAESKC